MNISPNTAYPKTITLQSKEATDEDYDHGFMSAFADKVPSTIFTMAVSSAFADAPLSMMRVTSSDFNINHAHPSEEDLVPCCASFDLPLNDDNLLSFAEPSPFREGFSLQASPNSTNIFYVPSHEESPPLTAALLVTFQQAVASSCVSDSSLSDDDDNGHHHQAGTNNTKRKLMLESSSSVSNNNNDNTNNKRPKVTTFERTETHQKVSTKKTSSSVGKPLQEARWEEFFLTLLAFKEEHGHSHVPHLYARDPSLARWAKRQRYQYKLKMDGKPSTLTTKRLHKLEQVGFMWDPQTSLWETRRQELVQYMKEHGDCNVPCRYVKNPQLGMWVKRQRRQYKVYQNGGTLSKLAAERFGILNEMGFVWELRSDDINNIPFYTS